MLWKQAVELLGFGSAFAFAIATYGLFHFLDRIASAPARRAFSAWINGQTHTFELQTAILSIFDRLYSYPLLSTKAFVRSALLSIGAILLGQLLYLSIYHKYPSVYKLILPWQTLHSQISHENKTFGFPILFISITCANIFSDYCGLFIVRRWLGFVSRRVLVGMCSAAILGTVAIVAAYLIIFYIARYVGFKIEVGWSSLSVQDLSGEMGSASTTFYVVGPGNSEFAQYPAALWDRLLLVYNNLVFFVISSTFVYLWLPLMAFGGMGMRLLTWLVHAVSWTQWFIRQGSQHPLRAIGLVAAVLVFLVAAGVHVLQ